MSFHVFHVFMIHMSIYLKVFHLSVYIGRQSNFFFYDGLGLFGDSISVGEEIHI